MNRKYRQPGYQDSDRDRQDRPRPQVRPALTSEERIQRKSMRHAIDREANEVVRCHNCGRNAENLGAIGFESRCPHCAAPMRCCRTCRHFDTGARWQCRTEIEKPVEAKSDANRCPQYSPRLVLDVTGRRTSRHRTNDPRAAFDSLFKR